MKYLNLGQLSNKLGGRSRSSIYRDVESDLLPKPTPPHAALVARLHYGGSRNG